MNDQPLGAPIPPMHGCNAHLVPEWYGGRIGPTLGQIAAFYDRAALLLESAETVPAIWPALLAVTEHQRQSGVDPDWKLRLRDHRIAEILHEEPASAWAFRRPRGYPGDPHLIDFVYEHPAVEDELRSATMRGQAIAATISACAASSAVQERRRLLARLLDTTADRVNQAEALVLACGHFREAELCGALGGFSRIMALDQDGRSIAEMKRCYGAMASLIPVEAPIGRMIGRPLVHGQFDLIYAAGLYDYLDDATAMRLTNGMMSALKPKGRLLFANFCSGVTDYGYMDAFMDWRLIERNKPEMGRLLASLPQADIARTIVFRGQNRAAIYGLVQKK